MREFRRREDPGVVDEDVELPEARVDGLEQGARLLLLLHVGSDREGLAALGLDGPDDLVRPTGVAHVMDGPRPRPHPPPSVPP